VFEDEADPLARSKGVRYRCTGTTAGARLSETEICAQEQRLGVALPLPWRDVYRHFNGGTAEGLNWGDVAQPRHGNLLPYPTTCPTFFALQDVMPLGHFAVAEHPKVDIADFDARLIALAWRNDEAIVLDYRDGDDPKVGKLFLDMYTADPLACAERDGFWWPNMRVFFAGLYLQSRGC